MADMVEVTLVLMEIMKDVVTYTYIVITVTDGEEVVLVHALPMEVEVADEGVRDN